MPPEELGRAGHELAQPDRPRAPVGGPELHADRPQGARARAGMVDPDRRRRRASAPVVRLLGTRPRARTASTTARTRRGTPTASRRRTATTSTTIVAQCAPGRATTNARAMSRLNALLTSYLFLLWFDTRSGYQDTGPYRLADGRVLLLRAFNRLGVVALPVERRGRRRDMPYYRRARRVRARRRRPARHRLRHVGDRARRTTCRTSSSSAFFDVAGGDAARRSTTTGADALAAAAKAAQTRALPHDRGHGARATRSTRARTCTSRSCARSPSSRASSSTGPCRATASTSTRSSS